MVIINITVAIIAPIQNNFYIQVGSWDEVIFFAGRYFEIIEPVIIVISKASYSLLAG